ncbi:M1 family metallopeptidase [Ornithinimicrobium panacihumi]|uniref:M1 family metallopeptidase n=1 Tax=Ornithinimicrobium panacihumi TaxID=2008449 RepID=UPI003F8CB5D0
MSGRRGADPYVLGHGDLSFDVLHHDLTLTYSVPSNRLEGEAVLRCRALEDLTDLRLDLALKPLKIFVAGRPAKKFKVSDNKLVITLPQQVAAGEEVEVKVAYVGNPKPLRKRGLDAAGWEELEDGVIVASQPHGAPSWFPCNDRPSSRSTYEVRLTTAADYHVEFSGEPVSDRRRGATRSWVFRQEEPIPAYLATLQIGRYEVITQKSSVPIRVVAPADLKRNGGFAASFGRQPEMMDFFVKVFGTYPFASYTAVITDDDLEIPLESASLSTFGRNFASADWDAVRLVAHELSHQWFGNAVTGEQWRHIWLHEGFACYAEWLWSQECGDLTTQERAAHHHAVLAEEDQPAPLADPGVANMFDDWVYKRGALTLHALRVEVGDELFFEILRTWVKTQRGRSVTTAQFVEHCAEVAGRDLADVLTPWLEDRKLPKLPVLPA